MESELKAERESHEEAQKKLEEAIAELRQLKQRLAGLETPSKFDVPQAVLDKLDHLERTRWLEAVQAYKVNA